MPRESRPLSERIRLPGRKRMLALDGGGIRGLITIEILARLEELLRAEHGGDPAFRLADYFDYVAGTSTGAIIASCIALGRSVAEIRQFYVDGAEAMFKRAPLHKLLHFRHHDGALSDQLQKSLQHADGRDLKLGDDDLQTLLLIVMRNETTDSPWPISNNPFAKYNQADRSNSNLELPLWTLIRASTAAPTLFPPQPIQVGSETFTFVDGAVTVYNNPAFILFLMATLPEYGLQWKMGEEELLLVSIGTGVLTGEAKKLDPKQMTLLYNVKSVPSALIDAALNEQDLMCRVLGRCRFGGSLDGELGDLIVSEEQAAASGLGPFEPKKFTYVRYSPVLTTAGLQALGLGTVRPADVQRLNSHKHMGDLMDVGRAYAKRLDLNQLGPFDPRRAP